jgi:hypothetical protein
MRAKKMTLTTTIAAIVAAAIEGRRAYRVFFESGDEKMNMQQGSQHSGHMMPTACEKNICMLLKITSIIRGVCHRAWNMHLPVPSPYFLTL